MKPAVSLMITHSSVNASFTWDESVSEDYPADAVTQPKAKRPRFAINSSQFAELLAGRSLIGGATSNTKITPFREVKTGVLHRTLNIAKLEGNQKFAGKHLSIIVRYESEDGDIYETFANDSVASKLSGSFSSLAPGQSSYWMYYGLLTKQEQIALTASLEGISINHYEESDNNKRHTLFILPVDEPNSVKE